MRRLVLLAGFALAACATTRSEPPSKLRLEGEMTYRERVALPPGATARASLSERGGGLVAESAQALGGRQVPIPFAIELDRAALDPAGTYAVTASIEGPNGALLFESEGEHLIDARHPPSWVGTLMLTRAIGETAFTCEDGSRVLAGEGARLVTRDPAARMTITRAASGARYEGDGAVFWSKGDEAVLTTNGRTVSCTLRS